MYCTSGICMFPNLGLGVVVVVVVVEGGLGLHRTPADSVLSEHFKIKGTDEKELGSVVFPRFNSPTLLQKKSKIQST
jgi:hypothetical protein